MSASHGPETDIIDLTGIPLDELITLDDSVLARSLRRLRHEIEHPGEPFAGFQNFI